MRIDTPLLLVLNGVRVLPRRGSLDFQPSVSYINSMAFLTFDTSLESYRFKNLAMRAT